MRSAKKKATFMARTKLEPSRHVSRAFDGALVFKTFLLLFHRDSGSWAGILISILYLIRCLILSWKLVDSSGVWTESNINSGFIPESGVRTSYLCRRLCQSWDSDNNGHSRSLGYFLQRCLRARLSSMTVSPPPRQPRLGDTSIPRVGGRYLFCLSTEHHDFGAIC